MRYDTNKRKNADPGPGTIGVSKRSRRISWAGRLDEIAKRGYRTIKYRRYERDVNEFRTKPINIYLKRRASFEKKKNRSKNSDPNFVSVVLLFTIFFCFSCLFSFCILCPPPLPPSIPDRSSTRQNKRFCVFIIKAVWYTILSFA